MRRLIGIVLLLAGALCSGCGEAAESSTPAANAPAPPPVAAPLPDVSAMVKSAVTLDGARDATADVRLTLEEADGKREWIEFQMQRKFTPARVSTFIKLTAPREETDKALLAVERPDQATEAFSYLAGLKKVAKLDSSRTLNFRGSKVTVQEILSLELSRYTHSAGARVVEAGESLIKVEFKQQPESNLAFPRIVGFFREREQQPARFELYDERDQLQKTARIAEMKTIQNHRTATRVVIEDHQLKRRITLEMREVKYDRGLADAIFTEANLKSFIDAASRKLAQ